MTGTECMRAVNRLAKWRRFFASWQLGTTRAGDGPYKAVTDHREVTILLRAEVSALVAVLVRKGVCTTAEFEAALTDEARELDHDYAARYPGWTSSEDGLHMTMPAAGETMRRMGFPP